MAEVPAQDLICTDGVHRFEKGSKVCACGKVDLRKKMMK